MFQRSDLNTIPVEVVKPNFIDPKNERLIIMTRTF